MAREEVKGAVGGLKTSPASQNDVDIGSRKVGDLNGLHRESAVRLQAVSLLSCSQPACLDISVPANPSSSDHTKYFGGWQHQLPSSAKRISHDGRILIKPLRLYA